MLENIIIEAIEKNISLPLRRLAKKDKYARKAIIELVVIQLETVPKRKVRKTVKKYFK